MTVLLPWVIELPLMMQSVVLSATRGCDGVSKHDVSKKIIRKIREQVFVDAGPTTEQSFLAKDSETLEVLITELIDDIDKYPVHFVSHLWFALEIIGYLHPDEVIRDRFLTAYVGIIQSLHLNPETMDQLLNRLNK
jgi:hypothetical protein